MPQKKDPDKADEKQPRHIGAQFLGGIWYAADGTPLTAVEAQQAHRAMDAEQAKERRRILLGGAV